MRVPANKRHLVVNKEYSRLPYWTDDGYDDVQKQVSQKYVQDSFGKFAESENQPPYLSDADYQGLEYNYQDPQFPDIPEAGLIATKPSGFCEGLWDSLFGDRSGVFIPTASEWNKLNEYAKKCPLLYVPHICCIGMKINGPGEVAPSAEAEYSSSGGGAGCAYTMKAKRGEFTGSTYTAPSTAGSDEIHVTPWMSDDQGKKCAKKDILITGGCTGTISAVLTQMAAGATQVLTVTGGGAYDDYTWSTTSGSLNPTTGTSVTFTAPATNPNCANNATISLSCGGSVVSHVDIAINAYTASNVGKFWHYNGIITPCWCSGVVPNRICYAEGSGYRQIINCDGSSSQTNASAQGSSALQGDESEACAAAEAMAKAATGNTLELGVNSWETWYDYRDASQKALGCCPSQLM